MKDNQWERLGAPAYDRIVTGEFSRGIREGTLVASQLPLAGGVSEEWWNSREIKGFRAAMVARLSELVWPQYVATCEGNAKGELAVGFSEEGIPLLTEKAEDLPPSAEEVAISLGRTNEAVFNYLLASLVVGNSAPNVSVSAERSSYYWQRFQEIIGTGFSEGCFENKVSASVHPMVAYLARGSRGIRVVFDLPNLITTKAAESGLVLSPDAHRNSVHRNIRGFIAQAYLPTLPVLKVFNSVAIDKSRLRFNNWAFEGIEDSSGFTVTPREDLLIAAFQELRVNSSLPPTTYCPFFSGKATDSNGSARSLPSALERTVLAQLDRRYYPLYPPEFAG